MSTTNTSVKAELPGGVTVTVDIPGDGGASATATAMEFFDPHFHIWDLKTPAPEVGN